MSARLTCPRARLEIEKEVRLYHMNNNIIYIYIVFVATIDIITIQGNDT